MLEIKNEADRAEIYITGSIVDDEDGNWLPGSDGYEWPREIQRQLSECAGKKLTVYINSSGGSVAAGMAIANMISRHDKQTTAIVDAYCCSVATQILFSANKIRMPSNAYLLVHKPTCTATGTATEMMRAAEILDKLQQGLEETYKRKALATTTPERIHELVENETWLSGTEAAALFDIELLSPMKTVNCRGHRTDLKSKMIPSALRFMSDIDAKKKIEMALQSARGVLL